MKKKLALITIGQAPRADLAPDLKNLLGGDIELLERGALDGLSDEEIAGCQPEERDYTLVSRLCDGSQVKIAKEKVTPLLQRRLDELRGTGTSATIIMCSCDFPTLRAKEGLLIHPPQLLYSIVSALAARARLAVVMPTPEQVEPARAKWGAVAGEALVISASPYISPETSFAKAAETIRDWGADLCVLDCVGIAGWMRALVQERTGLPTLSALSVTLRIAGELIG